MAKFLDYNPDQAYLLPPSVRDVLGSGHLCFFVRRVVAKLNLDAFRNEYGDEGGPAYAPEMLVSVWLYAYALGVTSSRRLEQRIREDLAFRYLAGGAAPDHWTLNAFRRRHAKGLNDLFTRVVELARASGLGKLGARGHRLDAHRGERFAQSHRHRAGAARARARIRRDIRRWQKQCDADDPNEGAGSEVGSEVLARLEQQLERDSGATGAVAEIGPEETFADRSGQPLSAGAGRVHAGLYGDAGGQRGSLDRGAAGDAADQR